MGICLGIRLLLDHLGQIHLSCILGIVEEINLLRTLNLACLVTAQNHGYAVVSEGLPAELEISHLI
ncbi:MAG: hypothetical protein Ct9H300mP19_00960 [Dehalococcoidia bacterium]|nr:MAG: hypothetical protein Ct9H300mP19_00960 [Dehalococcoidia bacterium]